MAVLTALAAERYGEVLQCLAFNPSTPINILTTLANDGDAKVRRSVAGNQATPLRPLARLAIDQNSIVQNAAAANPALSLQMLLDARSGPVDSTDIFDDHLPPENPITVEVNQD